LNGRCIGIFLLTVGVFIMVMLEQASAKESTAESAQPERAALTILAIGDSTTAGTPGFRSPIEAPPDGAGNPESQYTYWLAKERSDWRVLNRGVNGERSDQVLARLDADLSAWRPDVVIVLAGVNDLYQGLASERVKDNLKQMYERCRSAGARVFACTILPYDFSTLEIRERMHDVNDWIRRTSREEQMGFCDTFRAMEHPAFPDRLVSTADGLHPDRAGYRRMGEAIRDALSDWLANVSGEGNL
jgi:lysophospholipase L1-like esterase